MADPLDDVVEQRLKGTPGAPPPTPGGTVDPDLLDTTFEQRLGTIAKIGDTKPEDLPPAGRAAWNAGWNLFDAATFGYGHQLAGRGPQDLPSGGDIKEKGVRLALANYQRKLADITASREQWQSENLLPNLITTVAGSVPTAVAGIAIPEAALGQTLGRLGARYAPVATQFLKGETPGLLARPTGLAVRGGFEGALNAAETSNLSDRPFGEQVATGAGIGAVLNPLTMPVLKSLVPHNPGWATDLASDMKDLGVRIRPGQMPGADLPARLADSIGMGEKNAAQRQDFARALSKTFGEDTPTLDRATYDRASQSFDQRYDKLAKDIQIDPNDAGLIGDLANVDAKAHHELGLIDPMKYNVVNGIVTHVQNEMAASSAAGVPVSGLTFRALTRYGSTLSQYARSPDPNVRYFASQVIDALHNAAERGSPAGTIPVLRETNREFKNMLIAREVSDETSGVVDPTKLAGHVERRYGNADAGDIGTLAAGGSHLLMGEPRRANYELSGRGKAAAGLGLVGVGAAVGHAAEEHGLNLLHHIYSDPINAGLATLSLPAGYAAARVAGPAIRRGVNPLIPPVVEFKNQDVERR